MKRFNTAGPCVPAWHYMVPPSERLPEIRQLVLDNAYFVVHAPRQTGKTTTLMALCRELTEAGTHTALHFSCEAGEAAGDDYKAAEAAIIDAITEAAANALPEALRPPAPSAKRAIGGRLGAFLTAWAKQSPRPIALVFDEIDALRGMGLITVLRQLRANFPNRPENFPASVILCGLRDVRDYKMAAGGDASRLGTSSPFKVKVKSLKLAAFTRTQVAGLLGQHTAETGQVFEPDALDRAWELTQGQPWLLNALANEVVVEIGVPLSEPVSAGHINRAKERLIVARATHLDSLVAKLMEPRVRRFIEPMLAGEMLVGDDSYNDDLLYVRDLGLLAPENPLAFANPIYREVILRVLAYPAESQIVASPHSFVGPDGRLDLGRLLSEFVEFWVEHGAILTSAGSYREVAPQLVLMAWLHRIVNGGGYVAREVGVGRGRIDVLVTWPYTDTDGKQAWQREGLELKVWAPGRPDPLAKGLKQLDAYLASLSLDHGVLALFDRRPEAGLPEDRSRVEQAVTESGRAVTVLRL